MPRARYDIAGCWVIRRNGASWDHLQLRRAAGDYMGGCWSICRGASEGTETAVETSLRELEEETGLTPGELYRLGTLEQFYAVAGDTVWHVPFFVALVGPHAEVRLNAEHDAFRWVPDGEIEAALVWPSELLLLAEIRRFVMADHPTKPLMRVPVPGSPTDAR